MDEGGTICLARSGILRASDILASLRNPVQSGTAYLTFDDFPPKEGGDELLDVLRREGVKSTFFCIGENARANPGLVRRAVREGHSIQVHAWDHDGPYDFQRCAAFLKTLGGAPRLIRAPGAEKITAMAGKGWEGFTVDPYDYRRPGETELERRILYAVKPGAVIQLHAGVKETERVLPRVIASLRERSYVLGRME
ncbi:polysaccharide deacetylase family protein [bacterium]|nr:MAG: polysaccharide deacetylase family protein [bacterium]